MAGTAAAQRPAHRPHRLVAAVRRPAAAPAHRRGASGEPHARHGASAHRTGSRNACVRGRGARPDVECLGQCEPRPPGPERAAGHQCLRRLASRVGVRSLRWQRGRARRGRGAPGGRASHVARCTRLGGRRSGGHLYQPAGLRSAARPGPARRHLARRDVAPDRTGRQSGLSAPRQCGVGPRQRRPGQQPADTATRAVRPGGQVTGGPHRPGRAGLAQPACSGQRAATAAGADRDQQRAGAGLVAATRFVRRGP